MNLTGSSQIQLKQLITTFIQLEMASGVFLFFICVATSVGNGLLLLVFWKDPLKTFRAPTAFLVIGLAAEDFLTGVVVRSLYALKNIGYYVAAKNRDSSMFSFSENAGRIAHYISIATMNCSYITLLLLTFCQFTAVNFPHKHRAFVTRKRVALSVAVTWCYFILFAVISAMGLAQTLVFKIDLYFHTTGSMILLILSYFCIWRAFKRQMRRIHSFQVESVGKQQRHRRRIKREKLFTIVNLLLLTFVIVCILPTTVIYYLNFCWQPESELEYVKFDIAALLSNNVLFVKFALDPLMYAWRLIQYKRALKSLFTCTHRTIIQGAEIPVVSQR